MYRPWVPDRMFQKARPRVPSDHGKLHNIWNHKSAIHKRHPGETVCHFAIYYVEEGVLRSGKQRNFYSCIFATSGAQGV